MANLRAEMDNAELVTWRAYELTYGFPGARLEAAVALSGSAICQTWGAKVRPADLIPQFEAPKLLTYQQGAEIFAAMAQGHNKRIKGSSGS